MVDENVTVDPVPATEVETPAPAPDTSNGAITSEVTEAPKMTFITEVEDAVVKVVDAVEEFTKEAWELLSEQTREEITAGRALMKKILGK